MLLVLAFMLSSGVALAIDGMASSEAFFQDEITISGTVKAENGEGIPGANIFIKGSTGGTVTSIDGAFRLNVPDESTILVVSFIGYESKEVAVGSATSINVTLREDVQALEEVVVVGYGTQKKANLTGAVSSISSKEISSRPITSASQALQGQASGVWINQDSGEPGEDGATIRVRGIGTLNNANPLILVDGIEAPINNINPNDIESITVLKDAASAAIYGSRAANGVVLVTTKRGSRGGKPTINYSNYFGVSDPTNLPKMVTNSAEFMRLRNEADVNAGGVATYSDDIINEYQNVGPNTDWLDEVFNSATIQQHSLSISGGSDNTNYHLSLGYLDQNSMLESVDGSERFNTRLNLDTEILEGLTVGTSLSFARDKRNLDNVEQDGGVLGRTLRQTPNYPAFLSDGSGRWAQREVGFPELVTPNILAEIFSETRDVTDDRFLGSIYAEYEIIDNLKVRGTFAVNSQATSATLFNRSAEQFDWRTSLPVVTENPNRRLEEQSVDQLNVTSWIQASYEKSFGSNNFKVLGGFTQESYDSTAFVTSITNLPTNSLPSLRTGNAASATNSAAASEWALRSVFARVNYDFENRYLFEFNIRRDGSSRFGPNNRFATFPSLSAGWVLSEEAFLSGVSFVDFLKLRVSWGQLGNQNIGSYPFAALISFEPAYNFGGNIVGGAAQTTLGNPNIRWETTTQLDVGLNADFLNGRLNFEWDYFVRTTEDILFDQRNPGVSGVRIPQTRNIAEVENKGWESMVSWRESRGDFTYGVSFNVTSVESEVIRIDPAATGDADIAFDNDDPNFAIIRGQPINAIYGFKVAGIYQSQSEIDGAADQSTLFGAAMSPGNLRFEDRDGNGVIDLDDRQVLGQDNPTLIYGINLNVGYKGLDFAILFQGVDDAQSYGSDELFDPFHNNAGLASFWKRRWTPENPNNEYPRLEFAGGLSDDFTNSFFVQDRSYIRMKNIQLGYTFPKELFANNFIQSLRVFVNGQNLWTKTDYLGFDPERAERTSDGGAGFPQLKTVTGGLNLTF